MNRYEIQNEENRDGKQTADFLESRVKALKRQLCDLKNAKVVSELASIIEVTRHDDYQRLNRALDKARRESE